ncbi:MAG: tetratricopeptide repeat protein, partial [Chloroflexi bacterium]|nr:tetratricopeptide repeat protein [Chloroflexota bacterium]
AEEWCLEERRHREESCLNALRTLAAAAAERGAFPSAVSYLRRAISMDPFREDLQSALMQALVESGDRPGAMLVYKQFRALLGRELGTAPAEPMTALFRQIRQEGRQSTRLTGADTRPPSLPGRSVSGARGSASHRIPSPLTELVGRDQAIEEITRRIERERLVTLTGTGGVGKTRLAMQVGEDFDSVYGDGARFVSLAPVADAQALPAAVRTGMGLPSASIDEDLAGAVEKHLAKRELLLVLDNCEHLLNACAVLANDLLCRCPGLRILATSRQPLGLPGESVWRVPSLALPPPGSKKTVDISGPGAPETFAAVKLFVERAHAVESSFHLTPSNAPAIVSVCRRLEGIPLAIELAAAWVRSLSIEEIDLRLSQDFGLVAGAAAEPWSRRQTLSAAFEWSWNLLSTAEQIMLRRLSVFAGGWTLDAAEAVCSEGTTIHDDVLHLLTSLIDKSLVVYLPAEISGTRTGDAAGEARYHLPETIRQFAAQRLRECDEWGTIHDRHRDYLLLWTEGIRPRLRGVEQAYWFGRLEVEHDNLRGALEWSRSSSSDVEKHIRLVVAAARFWDTHGHLREGRAHLDAAIARMTSELPYGLQIGVHIHAGWMAHIHRDYRAARSHYQVALDLGRAHNEQGSVAVVLNLMANAACGAGDPDTRALYEESLATARGLEPAINLSVILNNLGFYLLSQGDDSSARAYLEESAAWCESTDDNPQQHGITLSNLAAVDFRQERYADAQAHCVSSLQMLHGCGAVTNIPGVMDQLALLAQVDGQWERSARLFGAAESLRETSGLPAGGDEESVNATRAAAKALGTIAFDVVFAEGRSMNLEQAMRLAIAGCE